MYCILLISRALTQQTFSLSFLALVKSVGLRNDCRLDDRSYWASLVSSISVVLAVLLVFPRLIPIHDLATRVRVNYTIMFLF
jgi:hypothetical protein